MDEIEQYRADRRAFFPTTWADIQQRGWDADENPLDFVIVSGDAYVDHPSFAAAVISRVLDAAGYRVGIISQPDWRSPDEFRCLGRPRLAFLVSAGNVDSMVANYTVSGKPRRRDSFSPGGLGGRRPDRATLVYCTRIREAFKSIDIVIGGIEASLRRLAHYDYWSDRMRRSILLDAKADLLVYGMGESTILEIASALSEGRRAAELTTIPGTVRRCRADDLSSIETAATELGRAVVELPDWDSLTDTEDGKRAYAKSFRQQMRNTDAINGDILVERYGPALVVQNPASSPRTGANLDHVYELPYARTFHPEYIEAGGVPAIEEVRFSLVSNRGCFGGCSFCALAFHQGRCVTARSIESLEREARLLTELPGFKGYIHDVGGPTANFRRPACTQQLTNGVCKDKQCLHPKACGNLELDHSEYLDVLRRLRKIPGVKKVFVRSGIRYDYVLLDTDSPFLGELVEHHISGRLKVAPEHTSPRALAAMGKPGVDVYDKFAREFRRANDEIGAKQFLVPYFISSHPGTTLSDAILLAEYFRDHGGTPEQVQDFYPTPGTLATCMYYTETDPRTGARLPVPKSAHEKAMQRALLQFGDPKNYGLVREALETAGRNDLIGTGPNCLINSEPRSEGRRSSSRGRTSGDRVAPGGKRRPARGGSPPRR